MMQNFVKSLELVKNFGIILITLFQIIMMIIKVNLKNEEKSNFKIFEKPEY